MVNGDTPIPQPILMANPLVDMVRNILKEVEAGRITSLAFIGVNPAGGVARPAMGLQLSELYIGAALLQDDIRDQLKRPQQHSRIVAAPAGLKLG